MVEAFLNRLTNSKVKAISAGTEPAAIIEPVVVYGMCPASSIKTKGWGISNSRGNPPEKSRRIRD